MNNFDVDSCLKNITIISDTREQPTDRYKRRMEQIGLPYVREKLDAGDYSCRCLLPDGSDFNLSKYIAIERKMNIDELCQCFTRDRKRFEKEFERAKAAGTKIYLLVENGSWEKVYGGKYRSKMTPQALIASIDAFRARYDMQLDFCKDETSGLLIRDILYRELKEKLIGMDYEPRADS